MINRSPLNKLYKRVSDAKIVMNVIVIRDGEGCLSVCKYGVMGEIGEELVKYPYGTDAIKAVSFGVKYTGSRLRVHLDESVYLAKTSRVS